MMQDAVGDFGVPSYTCTETGGKKKFFFLQKFSSYLTMHVNGSSQVALC